MNVYAIQHRACGHICGASIDRPLVEDRHAHLVACGYHQWRIRSVPDQFAAEQLAADTKCDTCRLDPSRAQMLLDETGQCRVCAGTS